MKIATMKWILLSAAFLFAGWSVSKAADRVIYLDVSTNWMDADACFGVHTWGGTSDVSKMMTLDWGNRYKVSVPDDNSNIIFVRFSNEHSATVFSWTNEWNRVQTTIPTNKNLFTITDWEAGSWSSYTPQAPETDDTQYGLFLRETNAYLPFTNGQLQVDLEAAREYTFKIYGGCNSVSWYTNCSGASDVNVMNSTNNTNWPFNSTSLTAAFTRVQTTIAGSYTFTLSLANGRRSVSIIYPQAGTATEAVKPNFTTSTSKSIQDGHLIIESNGIRYNAIGLRLR